ncbi:MAG: SatD family protein [Desulfohalobiaceae bacterium]
MEIQKDKVYAVLTGDIIGSSRLSGEQRQELYQAMQRASARLQEAFVQAVPLEMDIFRGDSWQLLVAEPEKALRIGLLYRLDIRTSFADKADSRFGLGIGRILFLPGERVSQGEGPAFRLSGQALDSLPAYSSMGMALEPGRQQGWAELLQSCMVLLDTIVRDWTPKQALAVYGALLGWTQDRIATLWQPKVSQQTIAEYLQKAGWANVKHFLQVFEASMSRF